MTTHESRISIAAIRTMLIAGIGLAWSATLSWAQNPGGVFSPVELNPSLLYRIELREYSMGSAALPTLHSFAVGRYDNKWMFISGRTNGLHGFDIFDPESNFPAQSRNSEVWVIDFESKQSWRRALDDPTAGLTALQFASLSSTNNQFYEKGDTLYITGGYGILADGTSFGTFDTLAAIDMPGLGDWVMNGTGSAADHIRQIQDPAFKVTGGAMYEMNGRTHVVFGQDFDGVYTPFGVGTYTNQIRSFDIVDDGTNLSVANLASTPPTAYYRRRDLNVVPTIRPDGLGRTKPGLLALSGVFQPAGDAWTVPVEIDADGIPSMSDPSAPDTFQQSMNNYHSAKVGFFSASTGEMHEILFGGISLKYLDEDTRTIRTDSGLPFVNDITSVVIDANGQYTQNHLGFMPELFDQQGRRLRLGTNAEFLLADDVPTFANGVIDFDLLGGQTKLGYIYGGIIASAPHVRTNPGQLSSASNHVFEVVLIRVPEPACLALLSAAAIMSLLLRRQPRSLRLSPN